MQVSNCDSDNISLWLETMNVFVGNFVIDFVNDSDYIDNLKLVFLCNVNVLRRFMIEMEPVPWQQGDKRLLHDFLYIVLFVFQF